MSTRVRGAAEFIEGDDLGPCPRMRAHLRERIGLRGAYRRAMPKVDPDMAPMPS